MDPWGMDKISIDGSCEMIMQEEEIAENPLMDCSKESLRNGQNTNWQVLWVDNARRGSCRSPHIWQWIFFVYIWTLDKLWNSNKKYFCPIVGSHWEMPRFHCFLGLLRTLRYTLSLSCCRVSSGSQRFNFKVWHSSETTNFLATYFRFCLIFKNVNQWKNYLYS